MCNEDNNWIMMFFKPIDQNAMGRTYKCLFSEKTVFVKNGNELEEKVVEYLKEQICHFSKE